jgi:ABC-2 type transport system permease protein
MKKIWWVARREFLATVTTRGFLVGVLMMPALVAMMIFLFPRLMSEKSPHIEGEIAIVDATGAIAPGVREYLQPTAIAARRDEDKKELEALAVKKLGPAVKSVPGDMLSKKIDQTLGEVPQLDVVVLPPGASIDNEKQPLKVVGSGAKRLALIVVHPDAVTRAAGESDYGGYDLYVRGKLDDRIEDDIRESLKHSIIAARVTAQGLDGKQIAALTTVRRVRSVTVTAEGEGKTNEVVNAMMPAAFMALLLISVMMSGQYLMTSTIEEKSNRVVEILLSAVSPRELMTGKVLGGMAVGLLIILLYGGLGLWALFTFAVGGLLDFKLFIYLIVFYFIAYFVVASMMAAVGSAVNELREAQTLMMPITMSVMIPWILWAPISRNPNSAFAVALSLIPPMNNFTMMLRLTSSTPPPLWQVIASIAIGVVSAYTAVWFAGKVFRIGVLMYGKPPTFGTLVRWARMA